MRRDPARAAQKSDPNRNSEFLKGYRWSEPPPWPPDERSRKRRPVAGNGAEIGFVSGNGAEHTTAAEAREAAERLFERRA